MVREYLLSITMIEVATCSCLKEDLLSMRKSRSHSCLESRHETIASFSVDFILGVSHKCCGTTDPVVVPTQVLGVVQVPLPKGSQRTDAELRQGEQVIHSDVPMRIGRECSLNLGY